MVSGGWPALPADLYFLRDGALWRWPAAGGEPERVAGDENTGPVVDYRLSAGGQKVAFRTQAGGLYVLDVSSREASPVPLRSQSIVPESDLRSLSAFDLTSDGLYLVYLALWDGMAPTPAATPGRPDYATLFAVDLASGQQVALATCPEQDPGFGQPCQGLRLSPDGTRVALSDAVGLWVVGVPDGPPQLLAEHDYPTGFNNCGVRWPEAWSPDGKWMLVGVGCYEGYYLAVMNAQTGQTQSLPGSFCYVECSAEAVWQGDYLWVAATGFAFTVYQARPSVTGDEVVVTPVISDTGPLRIAPSDVAILPDGRLGYANCRCDQAGREPGIYALAEGGNREWLAPLSAESCSQWATSCWPGSISWAPDGVAFLYLDDATPELLGLTDGSALWDVRELLRGARAFRWSGAAR